MTREERYKIVTAEIKKAEADLSCNHFFCGGGFASDVFNLNGRKMQIQVTIQADEDEFEDPTGDFIK